MKQELFWTRKQVGQTLYSGLGSIVYWLCSKFFSFAVRETLHAGGSRKQQMYDCTERKSWVIHLCSFFIESDSSLLRKSFHLNLKGRIFILLVKIVITNKLVNLLVLMGFVCLFVYGVHLQVQCSHIFNCIIVKCSRVSVDVRLGTRCRTCLLLLMPFDFVGTTFSVPFFWLSGTQNCAEVLHWHNLFTDFFWNCENIQKYTYFLSRAQWLTAIP